MRRVSFNALPGDEVEERRSRGAEEGRCGTHFVRGGEARHGGKVSTDQRKQAVNGWECGGAGCEGYKLVPFALGDRCEVTLRLGTCVSFSSR